MSRARPADAALAALATLTVTLPLTTLFDSTTWVRPAMAMVLVVAVTGMGLRSFADSPWVVGGGQIVTAAVGAGLLYGRGHLYASLPGPETVLAFNNLLLEAMDTVRTHTAPAPTTRGIVLGLGLLVSLVALAVDVMAVTLRSPTVAGLPLLGAYLGVATNSGTGLAMLYFVIPAAVWVTMVGRQGVVTMRRWATAVTRSDEPPRLAGDAALDFASLGRVLGVGAIAAAVLLTPLVPHLPTTFLADGLGRSPNSRGGGGGGIRLSSTVDISKNLADRTTNPVLTYNTGDATTPPFRVDVLSTYVDGQWQPSGRRAFVTDNQQLPPLLADPSVPRSTQQLRVTDNHIAPPQLAVPDLATRLFTRPTWSLDAEGAVRVSSQVSNYTVQYAVLDPTASDFAGDATGQVPDVDLVVDQAARPALRTALDQIVPPTATALDAARDIQAYLRSSAFTYSLTLDAAHIDEDPLTAFLRTKRGYCVQFATAMVMMARAEGIPARMAIGFLPGSGQDGHFTVVASDSHAWPELYFPRLGWVRFEPTPGGRSGTAPDYSLNPVDVGPLPTASSGSSGAATPTPSSRVNDPGGPIFGTGTTTVSPSSWFRDHRELFVGLGLLALLALLLPLGAWLSRRRRRHLALDAAARAEVEWQSLLARLGDVGIVAPSGSTPRQAGQFVTHAAYLGGESELALGRVVGTLERARYCAPGDTLPEVGADARLVWRTAAHTRSRQSRMRAALAPSEGVRAWSGWAEALLALPRWLSHVARRVFGGRASRH
jgi:transglutaminase-like putative cysteine protease